MTAPTELLPTTTTLAEPISHPSPAGQDTAATTDLTMPKGPASLPPHIPADQSPHVSHCQLVGGELTSDNGHSRVEAQPSRAVVAPSSASPAIGLAASTESSPGVADPQAGPPEHGHGSFDAQNRPAVLSGPSASDQSAMQVADARVGSLADPTLALLADVLDDLEKTRIANENRLRQLTRNEADSDGEERGFGLTEDHPDVARLAGIVDGIAALEHQATLNLNRAMRKHPLGPWVKAQRGVGEKQAARLLASLGDPYWNDLHNRPRTVSELWAYSGYHVIPAGQSGTDAQISGASGEQAGGDPGQPGLATHDTNAGVAPFRRKGHKANWNDAAKMRAHLVILSCIKAGGPYREVYDQGRAKYADAVHQVECKRCGPSGKPAQPGSPISAGHQHARAIRLAAKALLKDLWLEAKRIHEAGEG